MENRIRLKGIHDGLQELAKKEVVDELKSRFTREKDFASLKKLRQWERDNIWGKIKNKTLSLEFSPPSGERGT